MTREEAKIFLYSIAGDLGFTDVENYTCKDGEKMREAIQALEQEPCGDCISRVDAMRAITDEWVRGNRTLEGFTAVFYNLPACNPGTGRKRGRGMMLRTKGEQKAYLDGFERCADSIEQYLTDEGKRKLKIYVQAVRNAVEIEDIKPRESEDET